MEEPQKMSAEINPEEMTREQAGIMIAEAKQRAAMMGNNDVEWDMFRDIEERMQKGVITPKQAAAEANAVVEGKQR